MIWIVGLTEIEGGVQLNGPIQLESEDYLLFVATQAFRTWHSDLLIVFSALVSLAECERMLHSGEAISSHPAVTKVLTPQWTEEM